MIPEALIWKLIDAGFTAAQAGLERDVVIEHAKAMEDAGASAAEIQAAIVKMRDDAIAAAQRAIDQAP